MFGPGGLCGSAVHPGTSILKQSKTQTKNPTKSPTKNPTKTPLFFGFHAKDLPWRRRQVDWNDVNAVVDVVERGGPEWDVARLAARYLRTVSR